VSNKGPASEAAAGADSSWRICLFVEEAFHLLERAQARAARGYAYVHHESTQDHHVKFEVPKALLGASSWPILKGKQAIETLVQLSHAGVDFSLSC
jgi:hypothetical protein